MTKLTEADRIEIRRLHHNDNMDPKDIAPLYDVDWRTIYRVINYRDKKVNGNNVKMSKNVKSKIIKAKTAPIIKKVKQNTDDVIGEHDKFYNMVINMLSKAADIQDGKLGPDLDIGTSRGLIHDALNIIVSRHKLKQELWTTPQEETMSEARERVIELLEPYICNKCLKKLKEAKE